MGKKQNRVVKLEIVTSDDRHCSAECPHIHVASSITAVCDMGRPTSYLQLNSRRKHDPFLRTSTCLKAEVKDA